MAEEVTTPSKDREEDRLASPSVVSSSNFEASEKVSLLDDEKRKETSLEMTDLKEEKKETKVVVPSEGMYDAFAKFKKGELPVDQFPGAKNLERPELIRDPSGATLPTRLQTLGNHTFRLIASITAEPIGRSVVGWYYEIFPKWMRCKKKDAKVLGFMDRELVLLPWTYSVNLAKIGVFIRLMLAIITAIAVVAYAWTQRQSELYSDNGSESGSQCLKSASKTNGSNLGQAWAVGTVISLIILIIVSRINDIAVGVMPFLRSMGVPEVEEYMFSYSWSKNAEDIRTLGKAMINNGVGVWLDVIKLSSGDAIRPVVRTMMNRCYRSVVFLSVPYIKSPNCCVEIQEAIRNPNKMTVCVLEPLPQGVMNYLAFLARDHPHFKLCYGIDELLPILDDEVSDTEDQRAYKWWRKQNITISGVPEHVVPQNPIPRFSLNIFQLTKPKNSLYVGPTFLSGDCQSTGTFFCPPWLFIAAVIGVGFCTIDFIGMLLDGKKDRQGWVYLLLGAIALTSLAPFFEITKLINARFFLNPILKPLLASRAFNDGVRIVVRGNGNDPICVNLRNFIKSIGHQPDPKMGIDPDEVDVRLIKNHINIIVIDSIPSRDKWFSGNAEAVQKVMENSIVVYSGDDNPFTNDPLGQKLMKYLVLVKKWESHGLASSIFSGLAVRVVRLLHRGIGESK